MKQKQKGTKKTNKNDIFVITTLNMYYGNSNRLQGLQMRWQYGDGVL